MTYPIKPGEALAQFKAQDIACRGVRTIGEGVTRRVFAYFAEGDNQACDEMRAVLKCLGWRFVKVHKPSGFERLPCAEFEPI